MRINKTQGYARGRAHIEGIENFRGQAKRHLRRRNGVPKPSSHLFLAECERRFNEAPPSNLLKAPREWMAL